MPKIAKSPELEEKYGEWTPYATPLKKLIKHNRGFTHRWMIPVRCDCGRYSIVDYQNLRNKRSKRCQYCGEVKSGKRIAGRRKKEIIYYKALGDLKNAAEWARDPRCKVTYEKLIYRLRCTTMSFEDAITIPDVRKRGARRKLTDEQAVELFKKALNGEKAFKLAAEYGISGPTVTHLVEGVVYTDATMEIREELLGSFCNDNDILVQSAYGRHKLPLPGETFGCWTVRDKPFKKKVNKFNEWLIPAVCKCGNRAMIKHYCATHGNVRCVVCGLKGNLVKEIVLT